MSGVATPDICRDTRHIRVLDPSLTPPARRRPGSRRRSGRCRPRWWWRWRPRRGSGAGRARWWRRASTYRPAGPRRRSRRSRLGRAVGERESPNPTRTWLSTTSLAIVAPPAASRSAIRAASRQHRSTRSATPERPSSRSAAQTAKPRARRDESGTRSPREYSSRPEPARYAAEYAIVRPCTSASRDDGQPAVVGHVEPLVRVGRPGVGVLDAGDEVGATGRRGCPEPERAVDVHPRTGLLGQRDRPGEEVAGAGVHVARLEADDGRPVRLLLEHPLQVLQVDARPGRR